ncbi:MAG: hypothetical protein R3F14_43555 [Polyangiaceae bacterium]
MLRRIGWLSFVGISVAACAAGRTGEGTGGAGGTTTTPTTTTTTTTAGGGTGGTGGTTTSTPTASTGGGGQGGAGGTGGTTTTSEGGTGGATTTATTTTTTSGTGGSAPTETAVVLAGSAASTLAGSFHPGEAWVTATLAGGSSSRPAVALLDADTGVGLVRAPADGALLFTKYAAGSFSSPLAIGNLASSMDAPSITAWNGTAAAAYHKADFKHYFALYQGPMSGWSPVAEAMLANNVHSFGPSAPSIAIVSGDVRVAYAGDNGNLYDQRRVAGAWQPAVGHGVDGTIDLSPTLISLSGASAAMIAYVRKSDTQVMYTVLTGASWSAPAPVPDVFTNDPVALTPTSAGGAVLAFRGTNSMLYTCVFKPGNGAPWSMPQSFGQSVPAPPSLAPGIGGADAEMAFLTAAGVAQHARLTAGAWSAVTSIGGAGLTSIAITSASP